MNRAQWAAVVTPAIISALPAGTYSLRQIFLAAPALRRVPQAHEGVFLFQDVTSGKFPRISLCGKDVNGANLYLIT